MELDKVETRCYNCGKNGHMAKDCKAPKREKGACFHCGKQGHVIKDCRQKKRDGPKGKVKKEEVVEEPADVDDTQEPEEEPEEEDFVDRDE